MKPHFLRTPLLAVAVAGLASAQNDECATALAVGQGATAFDTTTATLSPEPWTCAASVAPDRWYTYTSVGGVALTFSLCGSTYDTALSIYDGTCGALNLISCNDDSCGLQSQIQFAPVGGTTYIVRVGGFSTATGTGTLTITESVVPPNDECATAIAALAGATPYNTSGGTLSPEPWSCVFVNSAPDIWYTYVARFPYPVNIETCGSLYDTALEVYSGVCGALVLEDCNDDSCGLQSRVSIANPIVGATYRIRVGGWNNSSGSGTLTINEQPGPNCVGTTFVGNNGGNVGGAVYFDVTFTQDVIVGGLDTHYSAVVGTPVGMQVYVTPGTSVGVETNMAAWGLVAVDDGTSTSAGLLAATTIDFASPLYIPAGSYGVALVSVGSAHRYTNGTPAIMNPMSADGVVALALGKASNVPFTAPLFTPRVWNGSFCYGLEAGTRYCSPAVANSTGMPASMSATGSSSVAENDLTFSARSVPMNSFGYFFMGTATAAPTTPPGSSGLLCVGGTIERGVGGSVLFSGGSNVVLIEADVNMLTPSSAPVMAGDTRHFQYWFRDFGPTSNFSDAYSITFQ